MKTTRMSAALIAASLTVTGCSLTPEYGCRAPDGVTCISASEVYDRDARGEIIRPKPTAATNNTSNNEYGYDQPQEPELPPAPKGYAGPRPEKHGDPIFREPYRLRVWVVDWEDTTGVYHPNHHLYVQVDNGEWLLPLMRERLVEATE